MDLKKDKNIQGVEAGRGLADKELTLEEVRGLERIDRIEYIKKIYIKYPRGQEILTDLQDCYDFSFGSPDPECYLLTGPTGAGKSTLINKFCTHYPPNLDQNPIFCPVVRVTLLAPASIGVLLSAILEGIGDPGAHIGTNPAKLKRIRGFIKDCRVRMLIIDEIQEFWDSKNNKIRYDPTNVLKNIIKEYNLICVLVGLENDAEGVVKSNKQLARLFPDAMVLSEFEWHENHQETKKEYRTFLQKLEDALPLRKESNLSTDDMAWRCFYATGGLIGHTMNLVRRAASLALREGEEYISMVSLEKAFEKKLAPKRRGIKNPFIGDAPEYSQPPKPPSQTRAGTNNRSSRRKQHSKTASEVLKTR